MSIIQNTFTNRLGHLYTTTADNHPVSLTFSISSPEDMDAIENYRDEFHGIGLFDTNFLYKNRSELPGEEEQFQTYKRLTEYVSDKPVNIRTCSLRAEEMPGIEKPEWEINPDLGLKGIRLALQYTEILKTQLKAILRANAYGHLHILLPMLSTPGELKQFYTILKEAEEELEQSKIEYRKVAELGLMADLPASIINAPHLCFDISFFQIGSELKNYTLGADFSPEGLTYLQHEFNPAFLNQINNLTQVVTKRNKTVGISTPLASTPEAALILIAVGIQEFIIPPEQIQPIKDVINRSTTIKARVFASKAMSYWYSEDVFDYARRQYKKYLNKR